MELVSQSVSQSVYYGKVQICPYLIRVTEKPLLLHMETFYTQIKTWTVVSHVLLRNWVKPCKTEWIRQVQPARTNNSL